MGSAPSGRASVAAEAPGTRDEYVHPVCGSVWSSTAAGHTNALLQRSAEQRGGPCQTLALGLGPTGRALLASPDQALDSIRTGQPIRAGAARSSECALDPQIWRSLSICTLWNLSKACQELRALRLRTTKGAGCRCLSPGSSRFHEHNPSINRRTLQIGSLPSSSCQGCALLGLLLQVRNGLRNEQSIVCRENTRSDVSDVGTPHHC